SLVTVGRTLATVGRSLVTVGRSLATVGRTLATVGRSLATVGRTLATVGRTLATVGRGLATVKKFLRAATGSPARRKRTPVSNDVADGKAPDTGKRNPPCAGRPANRGSAGGGTAAPVPLQQADDNPGGGVETAAKMRGRATDAAEHEGVGRRLPFVTVNILKRCIDALIRNTIAHGVPHVNMRRSLYLARVRSFQSRHPFQNRFETASAEKYMVRKSRLRNMYSYIQ
ncbi:MAG: hypothetical protein LBD58_02610, partial [Treponema sp.]|nr:hypothetical protein [Treponema sp.]